jgi:hypothetical protein
MNLDMSQVFVAISQVKTLKGLAFRTRFDHAQLKKPKETECHNQLGFQLDTFGMDLSEYIFSDD